MFSKNLVELQEKKLNSFNIECLSCILLTSGYFWKQPLLPAARQLCCSLLICCEVQSDPYGYLPTSITNRSCFCSRMSLAMWKFISIYLYAYILFKFTYLDIYRYICQRDFSLKTSNIRSLRVSFKKSVLYSIYICRVVQVISQNSSKYQLEKVFFHLHPPKNHPKTTFKFELCRSLNKFRRNFHLPPTVPILKTMKLNPETHHFSTRQAFCRRLGSGLDTWTNPHILDPNSVSWPMTSVSRTMFAYQNHTHQKCKIIMWRPQGVASKSWFGVTSQVTHKTDAGLDMVGNHTPSTLTMTTLQGSGRI